MNPITYGQDQSQALAEALFQAQQPYIGMPSQMQQRQTSNPLSGVNNLLSNFNGSGDNALSKIFGGGTGEPPSLAPDFGGYGSWNTPMSGELGGYGSWSDMAPAGAEMDASGLGAFGTDAGASVGGMGAEAGAGAGSAAGGSEGLMGSLGPIGLIMGAVMGSKALEKNNANNAFGSFLNGVNAPDLNQIKDDPQSGWQTLMGLPFMNMFTMNDKAKHDKPEWDFWG